MSDSSKSKGKIIKNASQGYGYKYSSLADLAEAGIDIPKMRIKPSEHGEYIEYLDDSGEWQLGARIVMFEAKGMNAAQAYGAALTYARRYTVQMAESVACDDDKGVENAKPKSDGVTASSKPWAKPSEKQLGFLKKLLQEAGKTDAEIAEIMPKITTNKQASDAIEKAQLMTRKGDEQ